MRLAFVFPLVLHAERVVQDHHVQVRFALLPIYGETDELGFSVVKNKVHVHDLQATILHLLGFDHEKLTYRFQSRDFRLTDVHGQVVKAVLG